jgi:DNA-binding Xre family transcriptional regulator
MTSPAFHLAKALQPYKGEALLELATFAGVPIEHARRARMGAHGRATAADHHLRLCQKIGIDPMEGFAVAPREPQPLLGWFFALGVKGRRILRKLTLRQAAEEIGVALSTLSRVENGDPRSFDTVAAICRWMGAHPYHFVAVTPGKVSRATHVEQTTNQVVGPVTA